MSVSNERMLEFARYVENNAEVFGAIKERVEIKLFARFRKSKPEEREVINAIMDNDGLFYKEIDVILAENQEIEPDEIQPVS